ncbi:MAG: BREX-1 system adenine-specific DNA-methyltransferase PglX [Phycisphaerae bacterium]|nr:BREX-1 system adenine-specific DNA-methyltransferase PglX [Phycisphaerae bacterium]
MNKSRLKSYAPAARREFIQAVMDRAHFYGLSAKEAKPVTIQGDFAIIDGRAFPAAVADQRTKLEERIKNSSFDQVIEEIAYTWFNRFAAIRYMELHGYLSHGYRVLSDPDGENVPEILEKAQHVEMAGLDNAKVIELKMDGTKDEELYRLLLVAQCNELNRAMGFLFESIKDCTELLLPDNLLHSDSLIRTLVSEIDEEDWQEVEILGWLYQFYISEKKDEVIGKVVKSEDIPAATQLFTPNWIVKYLVQNSLGAQWMRTYRDSGLKDKMEYYIEPADQSDEVNRQLAAITPESLNPEELTLLDPACGSGHILVEGYDLLKEIYLERGYRLRDIAELILSKNLFGIEIDDRAAQLSGFALMMKARADDRGIFQRDVQPKIICIQEIDPAEIIDIVAALTGNSVESEQWAASSMEELQTEIETPLFSQQYQAGGESLSKENKLIFDDLRQLLTLFVDARTFGSLIRVPEALAARLPGIKELVTKASGSGNLYVVNAAEKVMPIIEQAQVLAGRYDAVVANPPYMGSKGMNGALKEFAKREYPDGKSDLFAMFIERGLEMLLERGRSGMVTMQSWMFLSSYENLRKKLLDEVTIECMAHMANMVMGIAFGTAATVWRKEFIPEYKGAFCYVEYEDIGEGNEPTSFPPANERNRAARRAGK